MDMDKIVGVEILPVGEEIEGGSKRKLDSVISEIIDERFRGLVCAFDLEGKVLYGNDRVELILKGSSFYDLIPSLERGRLIKMFSDVHRDGASVRSVSCFVPLTVGKHQIRHEKVRGELLTFSRGLVLKIPEEVLLELMEMELEKLKVLLLRHPTTGLWITDERGVIVDILKANCKSNLGWDEEKVVGAHISSVAAKPHAGDEEVYELERIHRDGRLVRTNVVKGKVVLSNGHIYHVYLDTYFR